MSDDEEGGFSTIRRSRSREGVKLLYTKSKVYTCTGYRACVAASKADSGLSQVYMHPTPSAKDNVPGFIALVEQKATPTARPTSASSSTNHSADASSLLLCWHPEASLGEHYDTYVKVDLSDADSPPKQTHLVPPPPTVTTHNSSIGTYAFGIPVSQIYSLIIRPPSTGWWFGSVIINSRSGDSFPPLFFHDNECQSTINQRKKIIRESFDPFGAKGNQYWGGDEVLKWLKRYVTVESSAEPNVFLIEPSEEDRKGFGGKATPKQVAQALEGKDKSPKPDQKRQSQGPDIVKAWQEAKWNFLQKMSQVTTFTRRTAQAVAENSNIPPQVRRLMQNPDVQTVQEEFDSARLYLARWAMGIAEQSERERNQRIWTAKDVLEMENSEVGEFEILDVDAGLSLADRRRVVTKKEWDGWFDKHSGRLQVTPDEVKGRVFHGGLSPDDGVRKEAWLFLLGVYEWDSSKDERHAKMNSLRDEYIRLKGAWWERMMDEQGTLEEREWWKEQKMRVGMLFLSTPALHLPRMFLG